MKKLTLNQMENNESTNISEWTIPTLLKTMVLQDSIELIYKQYSKVRQNPKIFKIVYSCKDGVWNKSEEIEGEYIAPRKESYRF